MSTRTPPPEWETMLGDWGRASDHRGHVSIWWDDTVERWLLVEHVPRRLIPTHVRLELAKNPKKTAFRQRQYRVYQKTDKLPCAFWIIQGEYGGHKLQYNEIEAEIALFYTGSPTPPPPGSLPFAPFDTRVLDQLQRVESFNEMWRECERESSGDRSAAMQKMRAALIQTTDDLLSEAIDEAMPALLEMDLPVVDGPPPDYKELTAEYVETGHLEAPAGDITMKPYLITQTPK